MPLVTAGEAWMLAFVVKVHKGWQEELPRAEALKA